MHSTWSDGRDTIDQMVFASLQLGYEYVAITDHSERALSSRQLAAADIARQRADIEKVRARVKRVQILHGIEVDIMPDGSLDFDDEQLAGFDIVLASLHDHAGHDGAVLTERYLTRDAPPARERDHAPCQPDSRTVERVPPRFRHLVRGGG